MSIMYRNYCRLPLVYSSLNHPLSSTITQQTRKLSSKVHLLSPTARNLIHHYGLESVEIEASGPRNTLLKVDVLAYIQKNKVQPVETHVKSAAVQATAKFNQPSGRGASITRGRTKKGPKYIDIELSNVRKVIAKRLFESKSRIPHSYMTCTSDITEMVQYRQEMKAKGIKCSLNDIVIKATAVTLRKTPSVNVQWDSASCNNLIPVDSVDISIAVSTPTGLITPIIFGANALSIEEIAGQVIKLGEKARSGKLQPHEFQGGSFSISNLGMFGVKEFSAIINPPQVAILAVGRANEQLSEDKGVRSILHATLSYDARAIDEESAASFLELLSQHLSCPHELEKAGDGSRWKRLSSLSL